MTKQELETSLLLLGWTKSTIHTDSWWIKHKTMQRICIYSAPAVVNIIGVKRRINVGTHDFNGKAITYHSHLDTLLEMAIGDKYEPPNNSQSISRDDLIGRDADVIITDGLEI